MGPLKKRKLNSSAGPAPKRNKNTGQRASKSSTHSAKNAAAIDAASLAWKSAGDEYFGGIEVIEGVDVVKNGGTVQFVVVDRKDETTAQADKKKTKGEEEKATGNQQGEAQAQAEAGAGSGSDGQNEPFEGFGDGPVEGEHIGSNKTGGHQNGVEGEGSQKEDGRQGKKSKNAKASRKEQQQKKKKKKSNSNSSSSSSSRQEKESEQLLSDTKSQGNSFDALMAMDDVSKEETDMAAWMELNLSPRVVSAIAALGFSKPTTIQEKAIPEIMMGKDVIGKAQTGSGKTLAFGIPLVEKWLEMHEDEDSAGVKRTGPMAVVLSPTRELAKQLADHLKALCNGLPTAPYVCTVTGGLSIQKQQRQLEKADIVIGTPGRLWEVLDGDMKLQDAFTKISFLVVDEADRLFKAGQFKEAEDIIGALDKRDPEAEEDEEDEDDELPPRQTLVFSATFDKDLQSKLAGKARGNKSGTDAEKMEYLMKCLKFRSEPKFVDVNPVTHMAEGLKEALIECGAMEKDLYLYTVLVLNPGKRTLVFTNSISAVRRLTPLLTNLGLTALPLHSQMIQKARLRSVERFTASRNCVLVATDVAARGLDMKDIDQVLHYHVPRAADTYIHRSGRTARGGRTGLSVMLCSPEEVLPTRRLASKVHAERGGETAGRRHMIEALSIDGNVVSRLKLRVDLAKKLADAVLAKEKGHSEDTWLRNAADELGVVYDAEEFEAGAPNNWGGRGGGRKKKEKEARQLSKAEMGALRAKLRDELSKRVNLGVSERYITGGRVDIGALLKDREKGSAGGLFLGGSGLFGMNL